MAQLSCTGKEDTSRLPKGTPPLDHASQVEQLHLQVSHYRLMWPYHYYSILFQLWQCKKEIMESMAQREGQVPIVVHHQLEHCIRATEVCINF